MMDFSDSNDNVYVLFLAHGEKNQEGFLTEKGENQIEATAEEYLIGNKFAGAVSSDMPRHDRTIQLVLGLTDQDDLEVSIDERFYYMPSDLEAFMVVRNEILSGKDPKVMDFILKWPETLDFIETLRTATGDIAKKGGPVIIASHREAITMLSPFPEITPIGKEGDLGVYRLSKQTWRIESLTYYRCPL